MKRHYNTIKHPQRRRLGERAYMDITVQIYLAQTIITAVCNQTPEQRAAIRTEFDRLFPNFLAARS